ncbi:MAG: hypothetical protein P8183_18290, partial [Anaerolineae bacterium]
APQLSETTSAISRGTVRWSGAFSPSASSRRTRKKASGFFRDCRHPETLARLPLTVDGVRQPSDVYQIGWLTVGNE